MLSELTKLGITKVLWLVLFFAVYMLLINVGINLYLGHFGTRSELADILPAYDFYTETLVALIFGVFGALLLGVVEVFYLKRFGKRSFLWNLLVKGLGYILIIFVINIAGSMAYNALSQGLPLWDDKVLAGMSAFMGSSGALFNMLTASLGILIGLFLIQIDMKLGQKGLWNMITGKYHHPKEEVRIFMFLDLQSSTRIAEEIGHDRYYKLLNDFFADATVPIVNNKGFIYQYIGDEISVSWNTGSQNNRFNCIKSFVDIYKLIDRKRDFYLKTYGLVPQFKAGIHAGKVMTGEIGLIRKEVVHSGDVLNTASRIQSLCNAYNADLIVSDVIKKMMAVSPEWTYDSLGKLTLKGKKQEVKLYKVNFA
jgi:adenylate cyclase